MKVIKRFGIGIGAAVFLAGTALVAGGGDALGSPQSPVFPEFTTIQCAAWTTEPSDCTLTLLTKEQTRQLEAAGVPRMLGTWFGAEHVWALAGSDGGQGCVAFGLWADGRYVAFAAPMESDVENLKCV